MSASLSRDPGGSASNQGLRRTRSSRKRLWGLVGALGLGAGLTGVLVVVGLFAYYGRDLPDVHGLRNAWRPPQTTRILARDNSVLAELFLERRTVVPLERLPRHLVMALLAAEDADFYRHRGLDWPGMVRALVVNIRRGTVAQGASTITQQVVKNVLLGGERTLARKVREVLLARRIERDLSKNEILYLYVNHIAFGHGRNGVEEAARYYFGRHVSELTLGESVLLAGIPKSPVHYSPRNDLQAALRRRRWILGEMVAKGFISQSEADRAANEPVRLASAPEDSEGYAPEVVELARRALTAVGGDDALRRGGYTVYTTLDPQLQRAAREALERGLRSLDQRHGYRGPLVLPGQRRPSGAGNVLRAERPGRDGRVVSGHIYTAVVESAEDGDSRHPGALTVRIGTVTGRVPWNDAALRYASSLSPTQFAPPGAVVRVSPDRTLNANETGAFRLELGPQGAMVVIDPHTRELRAMVGGYDALPGMFNRATRASRQPGSAFKPFLYSYALSARRYTLASTLDPNPGCFGSGRNAWCPAEAHARPGVIEAPMRLRPALAASRNMVAARLLDALGPEPVIGHARALGVSSPLPADLSLSLGSGSVTPIELTNAYATWAAGGQYQDWRVITRVVDPSGRELALPARAAPQQAMGAAEAWLVTSLLSSVIDEGTARSARALGRPAAGKTGTTDRARDAWFVGYTPDLVAGVWVGFDDRQPLGAGEEGARAAVPVWTQFMREYVRVSRAPALEFARPAGVVTAMIDPLTGGLPSVGAAMATGVEQARPIEEYFLAGTEPQRPIEVDAGQAVLPAVAPSEAIDAGAEVENPTAPQADAGSEDDDSGPPSTAAAEAPGLVLPMQ